MSEQFYTSALSKKRRQGQRMTAPQRIRAQAQFLAAYEHCANIIAAAEQSEIHRTLVYYWQEHDEIFGMAFNLADKAANAHIEAEIRRRGIEGVVEPVVSNGQLVYEDIAVLDDNGDQKKDDRGRPMWQRGRMITVRKYSDTLLIFYAKKRMPEYRDKSATVNVVLPTKEYHDLPEDGVVE